MNDFISNGTEIKQRIISEIGNSIQCIYLAMAYFTDRDIAGALIESSKRGVFVDVILSSNLQNETIKTLLVEAGIKVHSFETGDARGIMHHKFCLIDNKIVINGSFNYSYNASTNNVENIQVSDNLSTYSQFHDEFERLKYNIDNNLDLTETNRIEMNNESPTSNMGPVEAFQKQLNYLVFSSAETDTEAYKKNGFRISKENLGNIDIFRTEYNDIKEQIRAFAANDNLGSKKNILSTNILNAFESTKANLNEDKQRELDNVKRDFKLKTDQFSLKINEIKNEKSILESGNKETGEKGLYQLNLEIEKNLLEKKNLEQSIIVKKFWNAGSILSLLGLSILSFYLSVFFGSAIYKVFFEKNLIRDLSTQGIAIPTPALVDANAISKIYNLSQGGLLFSIMATFFFIIPVLLSNLSLFGGLKNWVKNLGFGVGVLIFDIVVAIMVAKNQHTVESLINGTVGIDNFQVGDVFFEGEFWLIFVFGMLPLTITHFIISKIASSYTNSQRELVDSEKTSKIYTLDKEMIDLLSSKEILTLKINEKDGELKVLNEETSKCDIELNTFIDQIENKYSSINNQIKNIFDEYNSKIISGKIFTEEILNSVVSAFKSGFVEFFPEYFASNEIANRVREIERTMQIN